jgi:elongation factor Tu
MPTDPSFRMTVQDIFSVRGRGLSAIGDVESGTLAVGDTIWIQRQGSSIRTVVIAIDAFRKQLQQAQKGDSIGAVLRGIESTDIQRGDVLVGLEPEQSRASWDKRDKPVTTYRNDKHGFALDLPTGWTISSGVSRIPFILSNLINRANILEEFSYHNQEYLNIVVELMQPEIPPDINELIFTLRAQEMNYTEIQFGRIEVGGRTHAWVRYVMNRKGWLKKYMIVLNGYGYALTASCPMEHRSPTTEATWDCIAASFRLNKPVDISVVEFNNSPHALRSIELLREQLKTQLAERKRQ